MGKTLLFLLLALSLFTFSCKHTSRRVAIAPEKSFSKMSEDNQKFYTNESNDSEVFDDVVEIPDDFEIGNISDEDNAILEDIISKNQLDLKFGATYDIPIEVNPQVIYFIRYFQTRGKRHFDKWLKRASTYVPYIRKKLKDNNMPEDLVFVSMIESGFSSLAYSRARAVGPWQFMSKTGARYGLKINWWIDERRDLDKSTLAAIQYLKYLHGLFDDWYLAISAYNAGEGKIGRAIKRYKTRNYWELCKYRYIRRETKNYIPKMIAAALIVKNPEAYGFAAPVYTDFPKTRTVIMKNPADLYKISKHTGVSFKELKRLNPELRRWATPPKIKNYALKLPLSVHESKLANLNKKVLSEKVNFQRHRVRYGENLFSIARKYGTTVRHIKKMNKISNRNRIHAGQRLVIPVRKGRYKTAKATKRKQKQRTYAKVDLSNSSSYKVKAGDTLWSIATSNKTSPSKIKRYNPKLFRRRRSRLYVGEKIKLPKLVPTSVAMLPVDNTYLIHRVRRGDNLTDIAKRYNTSISNITTLNKMSPDDLIKPGDSLRIKIK